MTRTLVSFAAAALLVGVAGCVERVEHEAPRARAAETTKVIHEHRVVQPVVVEEKDDPAFEGRIDVGNAHGSVRIPGVDVEVNGDTRR
jgi:hypothetical protein